MRRATFLEWVLVEDLDLSDMGLSWAETLSRADSVS